MYFGRPSLSRSRVLFGTPPGIAKRVVRTRASSKRSACWTLGHFSWTIRFSLSPPLSLRGSQIRSIRSDSIRPVRSEVEPPRHQDHQIQTDRKEITRTPAHVRDQRRFAVSGASQKSRSPEVPKEKSGAPLHQRTPARLRDQRRFAARFGMCAERRSRLVRRAADDTFARHLCPASSDLFLSLKEPFARQENDAGRTQRTREISLDSKPLKIPRPLRPGEPLRSLLSSQAWKIARIFVVDFSRKFNGAE